MTSTGAASSKSCAWEAMSQPRMVPSEETVQYSPLNAQPQRNSSAAHVSVLKRGARCVIAQYSPLRAQPQRDMQLTRFTFEESCSVHWLPCFDKKSVSRQLQASDSIVKKVCGVGNEPSRMQVATTCTSQNGMLQNEIATPPVRHAWRNKPSCVMLGRSFHTSSVLHSTAMTR